MDPGSSTYAATLAGKDALAGALYPPGHPHHRHLPRPRAPHRPGQPPGVQHPGPAQRLEDRNAELDAGNMAPSSQPPAATLPKASRPANWTRNRATSSATPTRCATPASRTWACSPARAPSKGSIKAIAGPARETARHALDCRERRRHHRPPLPASQRPAGRAVASPQHPASPATRGHLTDSKTQTSSQQARARSSPTKLVCTPYRPEPLGLSVADSRVRVDVLKEMVSPG